MTDEKTGEEKQPTVKLQIKRRSQIGEDKKPVDMTPPKVSIGHGEFRGEYARTGEPFEVEEDEAHILLQTGEFETVPEVPAKTTAPTALKKETPPADL